MIRSLSRQRSIFSRPTNNGTNYACVSSIYTTLRKMVSIRATRPLTLVDEKVTITLKGLEPASKVTLRSQLDELDMRFEAHAHYQADEKGTLSLSENSSLGGSFTGVEPMGMFWSMQPSPGQRPGLRYKKNDVTTPMDVKFFVYNGHLSTEAFSSMEPLAKTIVQKTYMGPNVERHKVHHGRIRGRLYKPKGPGPFPAIIDMYGHAGGIVEFRSALLASRGFASFCLPYFGFEDLPATSDNIRLEYFEEAIDWLLSQSFVLPGGVGAVGTSSGGQLSLQMATYFPDKVKAAVSVSGLTAPVTVAVNTNGCTSHVSGFNVSYQDEDFPKQEVDLSRMKICEDKSRCFLHAFDDPKTWKKDVFIKVEKAKGQLLYIVGEDDLHTPAEGMMKASVERLKAIGRDNYQVLTYPKAGHMIEPPFAPVYVRQYHKVWGHIMNMGGSIKGHADAQEDSWPRILEFLYKHVGGVSYDHHIQAMSSSG